MTILLLIILDGGLVDSSIKLGSLLIDMDELNEASLILDSVMKEYPKKAIIFLHLAELQIHKSEFHSAVALLKKAQKILEIHDIVPFAPNFQDFREMNTKNLTSEEITLKKNRRKKIMEKRRQLQKSTERQLSANTFALLGTERLMSYQRAIQSFALSPTTSENRNTNICTIPL